MRVRVWEERTAVVVCLSESFVLVTRYSIEATSVSKGLAFPEQLISLG